MSNELLVSAKVPLEDGVILVEAFKREGDYVFGEIIGE